MAIAEIKWKLVKDTYFFDTTNCYLSENGNHLFYVGNEKRIEILIDDLNELVRKGCALWLELGEYEFGLDRLSKCPTTTWYSINQMLYSLEPWGVMKESKKLARKSIKEEYDPTDDIVNKGNSVSMNYKQFIDFIDSQGYKLNITDATIFLGSSHGDFEVHGNEMQVIPSEDKLIVNDNHSDIEFSTKNISEVRSVSLKSNILCADFITKQGSVLTVWWEL